MHLKKYIKRIKGGDLYHISYSSSEREVKHVGWKEKPVME